MQMIDLPSPFAPLHEWEIFLEEIMTMDQDDPDVSEARKEAEKEIERIKKEQES